MSMKHIEEGLGWVSDESSTFMRYDQKKCLRDPETIGERKNKGLLKGGGEGYFGDVASLARASYGITDGM